MMTKKLFAGFWLPVILLLIVCCNEEPSGAVSEQEKKAETTSLLQEQNGEPGGLGEPSQDNGDDFEWYYVVVLDSSRSFDVLSHKIHQLSESSGIKIDSMGRGFDREKNMLVVLPGEDEMYEGAYVPRRFESDELSIEYLSAYREDVDPDMFILIAGLYISKAEAESSIQKLREYYPHPTLIRSRMFTGCIH